MSRSQYPRSRSLQALDPHSVDRFDVNDRGYSAYGAPIMVAKWLKGFMQNVQKLLSAIHLAERQEEPEVVEE
jgi:hypothetical protein